MKKLIKKIRDKWKEINTEGYEGKISIELSLEQIIFILTAIIILLWIVTR